MKAHRTLAVIALLSSFAYGVSMAPLAIAADNDTAKSTIKKTVKKETAYVGSTEGRTYHEADSSIAKKIKPEHLVRFSSKEEAEKAGYSPSKRIKN